MENSSGCDREDAAVSCFPRVTGSFHHEHRRPRRGSGIAEPLDIPSLLNLRDKRVPNSMKLSTTRNMCGRRRRMQFGPEADSSFSYQLRIVFVVQCLHAFFATFPLYAYVID